VLSRAPSSIPAAALEIALATVSEGVAVWDASGHLVAANRRIEVVLGMPAGTAVPGLSLREFVALATPGRLDPGTPDDAAATLHAILARREALTWDTAGPDGVTIRVLVRPTPDGGWVAIYEDMTDRLRSQEKAAYLAGHDPLTGLPNRLRFSEQLAEAMARGGAAAVLLVDLDRFKEVNDTLGHPAGDALLRAVGARLAGCFRRGDALARLGGDEFAAALVRGEGEAEAVAAAERIVEALCRPFDLEQGRMSIGASVGIALAPRDAGETDALLRAADLALYAAKADGRGTYRLYEPAMGEVLERRRRTEADLRRALAEEELDLHYQPIVCMRTGRVDAMEALMRWHHPERGPIPPADFIPVAEASRLIVPMGAWALARACRDAARWPAHVRVAVNLSPAQFLGHDLVADVRRALSGAGLAPSRLELEITESVLMRDEDRVRATLEEFRAHGVRVAMDDFGTGYSSLGYFQRFPFDKVKIDRSFVAGLGQERRGATAIIRAVTGIAAALGMETVAEGVETREQLAILAAEGCSHVQGWLFGRPGPAAQVATVITGFEQRARHMAAKATSRPAAV
jgi:diguanylate cyclase (GGDEF)-like protein